MKKYLLSVIILFTVSTTFAQDIHDTLVFDLSQQTIAGGHVQFPVYFLSNDVINAVDFSLSYNTFNLAYSNIVNLTTYLNVTSNEVHSSDTTIMCSAYSLQTITNDTPLVQIRFTPPGQICAEDFIAVTGLLNGNAVTVRIVDCSTVGIANANNDRAVTGVYPNPASENTSVEFSLRAKSKVAISIYDITGKMVEQTAASEYSSGNHSVNLNLSGLENGVYFIRINSGNEITSTRISIVR